MPSSFSLAAAFIKCLTAIEPNSSVASASLNARFWRDSLLCSLLFAAILGTATPNPLFAGLVVTGAATTGKVAVPLSTGSCEKPAWLTELSLGVREGYDSNLFLSMNSGVRASWFTAISPKACFNLVPLLGKSDFLQAFSLAYVPDFVLYHDNTDETYYAHRFLTTLKGKSGPVSLCLDNAFSYVSGSDLGPTYQDGLSAFSVVAPRERREQFQDRAKFAVRCDAGNFFVRPAASLLFYDMKTRLLNLPGYINYEDRYDVNGGIDFGYLVTPDVAVTVGYRFGHQYQQPFPWNPESSSSDYHRVLGGIEGKPFKWLTLEAQAGPDFRQYSDTTPLVDKNPVKIYADLSATAQIDLANALIFKLRRFQWVSCIGKVPYLDNVYDLSFRHDFTKQLQVEVGIRGAEADYNPIARDDWDLTVCAAVRYAITPHFGVEVTYAYDRGLNEEEGIVNSRCREFERHSVSFGVQTKY